MKKSIFVMGTILVVVFGLGFLLFSQDKATNQINNEPLAHPDSYVLGSASAKVTITEFADFQCPACASSAPIIKQISDEYKDQVKIVFRHFPLQQHRNARSSAYAAESAGEQGKFWEMYELFYQKQSEWGGAANPSSLFSEYAKELNLDVAKFEQAMTSGRFDDKIERDVAEAQSLGINSTPTFFINGEKYVGVPGTDFRNKINEKLNK